MKKNIVLSILFAVGSANAAVTLSNPASVPTENIALSQPDSAGASIVQARNLASDMSQWRAITQTFQWNSVDAFDGIGLHMGTGNDTYWTSTSTQTYQLVIQALDANVPTQTVLNVEFQLTGDKVADGEWLYIDTDDVDLLDGQWYGFSLAPAETTVNGGLRTLWSTASSNAHDGIARQYAPDGATLYIPKEDTYVTGGSVNDYAVYMLHAQSVILSNPSNAPTLNVVVSQFDSSGNNNVQARNRASNGSDWRGISQTFQWPSTNAMDGIGLYMGVGNDTYWTSTSTQTYTLVIQAVDASNIPTSTVAVVDFYLTDDKVADGEWLYLDIPDVNLENNLWYGFSLCPPTNAVNAGLRTYWDTASGDVYAGLARQFDPSTSSLPKTDSYAVGGGVPDYTFYLVQSVDAGAAPSATILGWSAVSGNLMEMVVAVPGTPSLYHPESRIDLVSGVWTNVAHSLDGNDPFVVTNLGYSATSGDSRVIYVKAEGGQGFFDIIGTSE